MTYSIYEVSANGEREFVTDISGVDSPRAALEIYISDCPNLDWHWASDSRVELTEGFVTGYEAEPEKE